MIWFQLLLYCKPIVVNLNKYISSALRACMHLCIDVEGGKKGCCGHNRIIGIIVFEKCFMMMMILEYISIMVIDKEKSTCRTFCTRANNFFL